MAKEKITYKSAVTEIEQILELMEREELDVDEMSEKVKRVSELIRICRQKLLQTQEEVEKVLKEIED
ncbi:exodeoxyribonuclease VII small subunit [Xiashengella succiniciproducens]|jgi:exodeoxyribonuclease VII small subunit|uniref:Exodeoxyribonuclease VII small subunit n=1 Tax=Xiashengella succiniciproducens TaxID=2949635 RepID=A0A9J6ZS60_9BACT|nr:exodeoxyribonuclease VII small subunit [Alkaliflexus sp. Ai-910]MDI9539377.1 exodeoxyribonuclease VII small subunit [Bacteroidota bacterium]URW80485.1 exodeoxyribonuclease VII small subunit [Alkaliflexus sp. Ai-910]HHT99764.1 exodeoxyribonuclease VII small subunit [Bacteroidales bacterium]